MEHAVGYNIPGFIRINCISTSTYSAMCEGKIRLFFKGGRSASKIRKSQIRKVAKFYRLAGPPQMKQFVDFVFADPIIFCKIRISELRTKFFADLKLFKIGVSSSEL